MNYDLIFQSPRYLHLLYLIRYIMLDLYILFVGVFIGGRCGLSCFKTYFLQRNNYTLFVCWEGVFLSIIPRINKMNCFEQYIVRDKIP